MTHVGAGDNLQRAATLPDLPERHTTALLKQQKEEEPTETETAALAAAAV